jgi:maltose alpha-D-glucosyltransferase/alpha-amylase
MGTRLGELHEVLARPSDDAAFDPLPTAAEDAEEWAAGAVAQLNKAFDVLTKTTAWPDQAAEDAVGFLLGKREAILALPQKLGRTGIGSLRTRIHGDFHLGQVLFATGDAYIIDFEGEPGKPVSVRRTKTSPMRDVAGLLRSFQYAAAATRMAGAATPMQATAPDDAIYQRFIDDMTSHFLTAYNAVEAGAARRWMVNDAAQTSVLDLFLLEKSAYEICYEAANRPAWLGIPLRGLAQIAARVLQTTQELEHA